MMLPWDANQSGSSVFILLVGVAVSIKTVSFFDNRLLKKAKRHNYGEKNKQ